MSTPPRRLMVTWLAAAAVMLAAVAPSARADNPISELLGGHPPPAPTAPVAAPITSDPDDGFIKGTVIMVHGGGWAGHDANAQNILMDTPGKIFHARGWRVVSIDYDGGTAGLADVLDTASDELTRGGSTGPLCIYGESAGAQLALVAAARFRSIDCVIGVGTPTDLPAYEQQEQPSTDTRVQLAVYQAEHFFGTTPASIAPWDPIELAPEIHSDVLLMYEGDDVIVPREQSLTFQAASPTTQVLGLEAGDPNDPSTKFVHGTISPAGRAAYAAAIGAFADREVASHAAQLRAKRTGCAQTSRPVSEIGRARLRTALACLARKDAARHTAIHGWHSTSVKLHDETNAARVWARLRTTTSGKRALAAIAKSRASLAVRAGDPSRITLRAQR